MIEHGWIISLDARIVGPSIVLLEEKDQELLYFPALHFSSFEVQALKGIPLPLAHLLSPTKHELGHPDYRAAYNAALAHAGTIAADSGKRVRVCPSQEITVAVTEEGMIILVD